MPGAGKSSLAASCSLPLADGNPAEVSPVELLTSNTTVMLVRSKILFSFFCQGVDWVGKCNSFLRSSGLGNWILSPRTCMPCRAPFPQCGAPWPPRRGKLH